MNTVMCNPIVRNAVAGIAVLTIAVAAAGCTLEDDTDISAETPGTVATSLPSTPVPVTPMPTRSATLRPTQAPSVKNLLCDDPEFRSSAIVTASTIRDLGSAARDLADVLDMEPSAILLPEAVESADALYFAADQANSLALIFPDERISEDLVQYAAWLGTAGYFLQYGVTDADAAEAALSLRAVASTSPALSRSLDGYC